MARTLVLAGTCVAIAVLGGSRLAEGASPAGVEKMAVVADQKPEITGGLDGKRAWMTASYKGLIVRKSSSQADRTTTFQFQYRNDVVSVAIDRDAVVTVARGGRTLAITNPEALLAVQSLLGGSEAVFAVRVLLSEREEHSDLKAPEMSLLASAALVASVVGDTDAPRRLATRFVEIHRGVFQPVRWAFGCWEFYTGESTAAWNNLMNCMDEANQDASILNAAYRRLACNVLWAAQAETIWFQYLSCISPLAAIAQ